MKKLCIMVFIFVLSMQIFGQSEIVFQQGKDGFLGFSDHTFYNNVASDRKFFGVGNYHC